jgi:hypothetical protein
MAGGNFQEWTVEEPYLNIHCKLGEGPYYEKATNTLRWVDIMSHRVHTVSLAEGPDSVKTLQLDTPVGVTADVEGSDPQDQILAGLKYGLALLDRKTGKYEYISRYASCDGQDNERLRSNDGAVDPHGRFWMGNMTDFGKGEFQNEGKSLLCRAFSLNFDLCVGPEKRVHRRPRHPPQITKACTPRRDNPINVTKSPLRILLADSLNRRPLPL